MSDDMIVSLAGGGSTLRDLNLTATHITSQSLSFLAGNLPNLECLSLYGCVIDDTAMQYLALMRSLRSLDLGGTSIQGFIHGKRGKIFSFPMLRNLRNLETLNLERTTVRSKALRSMGLLSGLKELYLGDNLLADAYFHSALSLSSLRVLGFRDGVLTDTTLLSAKPSEKLKVLDLGGCWLLSEEAVSSFCEKFPQITVKHEFLQFDQSLRTKREHVRLEPSLRGKVKDERMKYAREELMAFTDLPPSEALTSSLRLPIELKKRED